VRIHHRTQAAPPRDPDLARKVDQRIAEVAVLEVVGEFVALLPSRALIPVFIAIGDSNAAVVEPRGVDGEGGAGAFGEGEGAG
jgi:hypothetical protein